MKKFTSIGKLELFSAIDEFFISENGFILADTAGGSNIAEQIEKNYKARKDDLVVASFPKSGTTWLQEIVFLIGSNFNFEMANSIALTERFPYVELNRDGLIDTSKYESPRYLKFHYPYSLLPKSIIQEKIKIFVPIRNPKDSVVSFYFFSKMNNGIKFSGDLSSFVELFVNDKVPYSPYWKHILEYWEKRHDENIFLIMYEEMVQDLASVVRRIAKFLDKSINENDVARLLDHCSFDNMKKNPFVNPDLTFPSHFDNELSPFMRKGKVGDWKNHLTEEMNNKMDEYIEKYFKDSGIPFIYEL